MYIQGELGYSLEIKPSVWFMLQLKNVGLSGWRTFTFFPTLQVFELLTYMSTYDLAYLFQTPRWHSTTQNKHNQTQHNKTKQKQYTTTTTTTTTKTQPNKTAQQQQNTTHLNSVNTTHQNQTQLNKTEQSTAQQ